MPIISSIAVFYLNAAFSKEDKNNEKFAFCYRVMVLENYCLSFQKRTGQEVLKRLAF